MFFAASNNLGSYTTVDKGESLRLRVEFQLQLSLFHHFNTWNENDEWVKIFNNHN